jgi:diguanylate cyclase (GGDEF)-like protein
MVIFIPQIAKAGIPEGLLFSGPISRFVHRYVSWFLIDLITSLAVVSVIGLLWRLQMPLNWGFEYLAALAVILAFIFSWVNSVVGLNRVVWPRATVDDGMGLALSGMAVTLFLLLLNYLQSIYEWFSLPSLPVIMVLLIGLISQLGFLVVRYRWRVFTAMARQWLNWRKKAPGLGERVLIVGSGEGFQTAVWLLRREELRYLFTIVGVVDDDIPTQLGMWVNGCMVLGGTAAIPGLVKKYDIGVILFTIPNLAPQLKEMVYNICRNSDLRISFLNQVVKILSQQLTVPVTALDNPLGLEDALKYISLHDTVTGLPNRFLLRDQLMRSMAYSRRYKTRTTVMFIQLDGFSTYSDAYGQKACKQLLKQLTTRLLRFKRESDTLAYLEGGEFGFILENMPDEAVIPLIAKRIHHSASESFNIFGQEICLNPVISICANLDECSQHVGLRNEDVETYLAQRKAVLVSEGDENGLE